MSQRYSKIIGTGSYLPPKIVTNDDLSKFVDTDDKWVVSRTGIKQRHVAETETTSDLATQAALNAIEMAGIQVNDIDCIVVATTTADQVFPSVASKVQANLGITNNAFSFDVQSVCAGFMNAIAVADSFIRSGMYNNILVIGADTMTKILNWEDRGTCVLFGDGAGAVILSASSEMGIIDSILYTDGKDYDILRTTGQLGEKSQQLIHMNGQEVFKRAVRRLESIVTELLHKNNLSKSDVDFLVPHQANLRIIQAVSRKFNISMDKVVVTVDKHANTSAASIPLALDVAVRDNRIKKGDKVVLEAIGGGMTWGATILIW